jgi:uncharacterized protein
MSSSEWLNEEHVRVLSNEDDDVLTVQTLSTSDYWCRTHYGFTNGNAPTHMLKRVGNDEQFTLTATVHFEPSNQYDQAGLIVLVDANCWIKTSVEYESDTEPQRLGAVVTRDAWSDWSTQDVSADLRSVTLRIERRRNHSLADLFHYVVSSSLDGGKSFSQMRMARLCDSKADKFDGTIQVGLYCCSPTKAGFKCSFSNVSVQD